jgi:hypothetical protein
MVALEIRHLGSDLGVRREALGLPSPLPLENAVASHPWAWLGFGFLAVLAVFLVITLQGKSLRHPLVRGGIVSFELARTTARVREILGAWEAAGKAAARLNLGIDFAFILVYAPWMYLAVAWAQHQWRGVWPAAAWVGWFLAFGQLVAGTLDVVEDVLLLQILGRSDPGTARPRWAARAARLKFSLLGAGLLYLAAGLVRHAFA